jgi:hypothetical protein
VVIVKQVKLIFILALVFLVNVEVMEFNPVTAARIDCWALIIGISDYEQVNDLKYPHYDANDITDVLINYHGWPESHIYKLINSTATKSNILDHIARIDSQEDSDDLFLFFFAGHGSQGGSDEYPYDEADGIDEYIIPYDCDWSTGTAIRDDELEAALDNLESSRKVVILDTCFSGGFARGAELQARSITLNDSAAKRSIVPESIDTRDLNKEGYVTLTSCDEYEYALESSELANGIFTYYMVEGLGVGYPADFDSDKMVSAEEAFSYASPRTTDFVYNRYFFDQNPQIYDGVSGEVELEAVINISVSDRDLDVANSAEGNVHFIYPDSQGIKPAGVGRALLSDWTAMGFLIGMCSNPQNEATDTNNAIIDTSSGAVKLEKTVLILTGGPLVNAPVYYYEKNRISPLYWRNLNGIFYWYSSDGTRLDQTALSYSQINNGEDMFVVESLLDNEGNKVIIIYGYGWKGTFAGGKFFKFIIYPNISNYNDSYYVFKWTDSNGDSFVDLDEISTTPIASG